MSFYILQKEPNIVTIKFQFYFISAQVSALNFAHLSNKIYCIIARVNI